MYDQQRDADTLSRLQRRSRGTAFNSSCRHRRCARTLPRAQRAGGEQPTEPRNKLQRLNFVHFSSFEPAYLVIFVDYGRPPRGDRDKPHH